MKVIYMVKKGLRYLQDRNYRFLIQANSYHRFDSVPDEEYLKQMYEAALGENLNLDIPKGFNEKLQWLKLRDRRAEYTVMVDKHRAKDYVARIVGNQYIIPPLGTWDDPDEIDFETLPDQFVLKCNHNSGLGMCICRDKSKLDVKKVKKDLEKGLKQDYYLLGREWPYKDVPRKIIAEKYISSDAGGLTDYKVHNFNGVPKFILVCKDRFSSSGVTMDFFTTKWEHMDVKRPRINVSSEEIPKPEELEELLRLSAELSKGIPFVRTDFYIVDHQIYFSELTFFPNSGFTEYEPKEWDDIFGSWLELPVNQQYC